MSDQQKFLDMTSLRRSILSHACVIESTPTGMREAAFEKLRAALLLDKLLILQNLSRIFVLECVQCAGHCVDL